MDTLKKDFARLIQQFQADVLVFETCTAAGGRGDVSPHVGPLLGDAQG